MMGEMDGARLMAGFDVFAMCSRYEGLPYVLLEAAARSLPIIATGTGGTTDVVIEGVNGFVADQDDLKALTGHMIRLARDDACRQRMGHASGNVAKRFTVDSMIRKTVALYKEVASENTVCQ